MTEGLLPSARLTQWPLALDLDPTWIPVVEEFLDSSAGRELSSWLLERIHGQAVIYPPDPFRFLRLVAKDKVRVVILGQDPYHGPGQAEGLAFSVAPGVKPPPSLRNIFKELERDLGLPPPSNGSLVRWAEQGVMLLNTCLTVEQGAPGSHAGRGWEALTDSILKSCNEDLPPKVFLFWGAHAQKKRALIDTKRHLVLCANHPSPLSALRGPEPFLGCGHFGEATRWLTAQGLLAPRW